MICINFATERDCTQSGPRNSFVHGFAGVKDMMRKGLVTGAVLAAVIATSAGARTIPNTGTPQSMQQLIACRSIADSAQRLACYDRQATVVSQALASKELVVIDKARATAAKRSLFGFSIPDFGGLFGSGDNDVNEIASTVTKATQDGYGAWVVSLADGSTWAQQDDSPLGLPPERGNKAVVHRGSFGAFFLRVAGQPGIRVKRIG
jgi:hypothetical protein